MHTMKLRLTPSTLSFTGKSSVPAAVRPQAQVYRVHPTRARQTSTELEDKSDIERLTASADSRGPESISHNDDQFASSSQPSQSHRQGSHRPRAQTSQPQQQSQSLFSRSGIELGPIGLSFSEDEESSASSSASASLRDAAADAAAPPPPSISSMTTAEWRALYEKDGCVDLWLEDEFNAGSRLIGGRAVHRGGVAGGRTGEGPSQSSDATRHRVVIRNHYADQVVEVDVPEDRYVLWEAEDEGLELPWACRMGCCTACAVRVLEGEMYQPEALGISAELREAGYGLMCVGYPRSDLLLETVPEDEVYELQFGAAFAAQALDPNSGAVMRDDYALEIASMDE